MKAGIKLGILFIAALLLVSAASAIIKPCAGGTCGTCSGGSPAILTINWTFMGAPGTDAFFTALGSNTFDVTIPAGAQGPQGEQGFPGNDGSPGSNGAQGPMGPMNQTPNMTAGPTGPAGSIPDISAYFAKNGTFPMLGNISMGAYYITGLHDPSVAQDAATKNFVEGKGYITSTFNATYDAKSNYNATYVTLTNISYLITDGSRAMAADLAMGTHKITGVTDPTNAQEASTKAYADTGGAYSNKGYTLSVQALTSSPADNVVTFFGNLPAAPSTTAAQSKVYIRAAGTIKRAEIYSYSGTAGTAETWGMAVRVNNANDYRIGANLTTSASERIWSNTSINIPVAAGDYIQIKSIQPNWATNPLTTIYGGYLYIE